MSWFVNANYYPCPFSRTVRRFSKNRCVSSCLYSNDRTRFCNGNNEGQSGSAETTLSSNTLHGVGSINDLRAWSACCDDRRRYFMEQMRRSTKGGGGARGGDRGEDSRVERNDNPDGGSYANGAVRQAEQSSESERTSAGQSSALNADNSGRGGASQKSEGMNANNTTLSVLSSAEDAEAHILCVWEDCSERKNSVEIIPDDQKQYFLEQMGSNYDDEAGGNENDGQDMSEDNVNDEDDSPTSTRVSDAMSTGEDYDSGRDVSGQEQTTQHLPDESHWSAEYEPFGDNYEVGSGLGGNGENSERYASLIGEDDQDGFDRDSFAADNESRGVSDGGVVRTASGSIVDGEIDSYNRASGASGSGGDNADGTGSDGGSGKQSTSSAGNGDEGSSKDTSSDMNTALDEFPESKRSTGATGGNNGDNGDPKPDKSKCPATSSKSFTLECSILIKPTNGECADDCEPVQVQFEKVITLEFELPEPEPQPELPTFNLNYPKDCCDLLKTATDTICRLHDTLHGIAGGPVRELAPIDVGGGDGSNIVKVAEAEELELD